MLRKENMLLSYNLADTHSVKGQVLTAKTNTILASLVNATARQTAGLGLYSSIEGSENCTVENVAKHYQDICTVSTDQFKNGSCNEHDQLMDDAVNLLKESVNKHISFARNVVKPSVVRFLELVESNYRPVSAVESVKIITYDLPELLTQYQFIESIKNYKNSNYTFPFMYLPFNTLSNEDLSQLLVTGDESFDLAITKLLSSKPDLIQMVYNKFFVEKPQGLREEILALSDFEKLEIGILLHLISVKLFDNPPEYLTGISLVDYNVNIAEYRDFAGSLVSNTIDVIKPLYDAKAMVLYVRPKEVGVIGDVYREWLQTGGSLETLFGMAVLGERLSTVPLVDENKERLERAWESHLSFKSSAQKLTEFDAFKDALKFSFQLLMQEHVSEEDEVFAQPNYIAKVESIFKELIETVRTTDITDRGMIALRLVAKSRFFYTDSFKILAIIEAVCRDNPKTDVKEAALIAAIEYMADYLADQIQVTKL